jgi:hypothetical protein
MPALAPDLERIVENSIARFKESLGWKANFITIPTSRPTGWKFAA